MDIELEKAEFIDYYYRQLELGFPTGSMVRIKLMATLLSRAGQVDEHSLMLDVRRAALFRLSMKRKVAKRLK